MIIFIIMKRVIQIQLKPTAEQASSLVKTVCRFNEACNWVAEKAFERRLANRYALHKLLYYEKPVNALAFPLKWPVWRLPE